MRTRTLRPIWAYYCPKDNKLKSLEDCEKCPSFDTSNWDEHQYCIYCKYEKSE